MEPVWCLFDGGATNSCSHPAQVSHLAIESNILAERFDLVTENCTTEMQLVRNKYKLDNNFIFETISSHEMNGVQTEFEEIFIPRELQLKYGLEEIVRVQITNHSLIFGFDQILHFPRVLEVHQPSGVIIARSGINGQILVARTSGNEHLPSFQSKVVSIDQDPDIYF